MEEEEEVLGLRQSWAREFPLEGARIHPGTGHPVRRGPSGTASLLPWEPFTLSLCREQGAELNEITQRTRSV